jgi:hypothetical protein
MLRSGVVIDANLSRRLDILRALDVGMDQRGIAAPILVRRIGQEDPGLPRVRAEPVEEPTPLPRYRVDLGNISEWRGLPHPRPQRVGRLSEALIEVGTAPSAGDMDEVAVEHRPFALVLVQAEIEELAQKSAALRCAESIRVPDLAGAGVVRPRQFMAQETREVARRQESQADHRCAGGRVDDMVQPAGNEARGQVDMARVGHRLAAF